MGRDRVLLLTAPAAAAALAGAAGLAAAGVPWLALAAATAALLVCVAAWTVGQGHFAALRDVGDRLSALAADPGRVAPADPPAGAGAEVAAIYRAGVGLQVARSIERHQDHAAGIAGRLGDVVASLPLGVLVLTESGLVTLANGTARRRFGDGALVPGTSVFDALAREDVGAAVAAARRAQRPVAATVAAIDGRTLPILVTPLGTADGAVLTFPVEDDRWRAAVDHALDLLDGPPPAVAPGPDTALADLPLVALDVETTGLDPARDRVLSIAAVRLHGGRIFRGTTLDWLVRPDVPIPPRSTAVHGIDAAMVADAPPFPAVLPALVRFVDGAVVVGHNVGFDLAVIAAECARAGIDWRAPPSLCLFRLADALDPGRTDLDLDALAQRFGLPLTGRHTALGDALLAAAVYQALLPRLANAGVADWGALQSLAGRSRRAARMQAEAGW